MEIWTTLPAWLRFSIALGLVAAGVCIFLFTNPVRVNVAGALVGVGFVLFCIGPSDGDKKGFRF